MTRILYSTITLISCVGFLTLMVSCMQEPGEAVELDVSALIAEDRLDEAQDQIRQALASHPRHSGLLYNLSVIKRMKGELVDARKDASKALSYSPNDPDIRLLLAEYALEFGATDEAMDLYQSLPAEVRSQSRALVVSGILLSQQRKWNEAVVAFQNALQQGGEHASTYAVLANALIQQGKIDQAKELLKRAEVLQNNSPDVTLQIAECYLALSDAQRAKELAMPVSTFFPQDARVWSLIGRSEMILLRFNESESAFTRALAAPNSTPWHRVEYAVMLFAAHREDEALEKATTAENQLLSQNIQIYNPSLYNLLATLYARDGQWLLANRYLTESFQIDKNQPKVIELLAKVQQHFNNTGSPTNNVTNNAANQ